MVADGKVGTWTYWAPEQVCARPCTRPCTRGAHAVRHARAPQALAKALTVALTTGTSPSPTPTPAPAPGPHQVDSGIPYDSAVDLWSVGVVLFIMLSGRHPFERSGVPPEDVLQAV